MPAPKGGACSQGGCLLLGGVPAPGGVPGGDPPPGPLLLQAVHILLECILIICVSILRISKNSLSVLFFDRLVIFYLVEHCTMNLKFTEVI